MEYLLSVSTLDSGPTVNMTGKARDSFSCVIAWIVIDMSKGVLLLLVKKDKTRTHKFS